MAAPSYDEIGFDATDVAPEKVEKYAGRKDVTDRVAFVFPTRLQKAKTHYKDKHIICTGGLCCEKLGPPAYRIGTVLIQYATNKKGVLETPLSWSVKHWIFSAKRFAELQELNTEFSLGSHDLKITCNEEKFQQLKFTPCSGDALWQRDPSFKAQVLKAAEMAMKTIYLGSKLDNDALRELLGVESSAAGTDPSTDDDFSKILAGVGLEE